MHSARDVTVELQEIARGLSSAGRSKAAADSHASRAAEGFWIAVLPFRYSGSNADVKALADGLSEETVAGLSRFSYLRVIARSSTAKYASESRDIAAIGEELGARYVLEGSIRQAGTTIRVAAQLVDSATGAHLWADAYDRQLQPDQLFVLQDELVPRIVSTCGDHFGVLARCISEAVRARLPVSSRRTTRSCAASATTSGSAPASMRPRATSSSGRSKRRRRMPIAGQCSRGSTRTSSATASTRVRAHSIARSRPLAAPWTSRRPIPSRTRRWPWHCSFARTRSRAGVRASGRWR